jgi:FkbM family methyltransferase
MPILKTAQAYKLRFSKLLREVVLRHYLVPYSRHGLASCLVQWWKPRAPVVVVDVGASHGLFISAVSKHYNIARAVLVEPLPNRCKELRASFKEPTYTVKQVALTNYQGKAEFNVFEFDYASSLHECPCNTNATFNSAEYGAAHKIEVEVTTLDALLAGERITTEIDLLKLDVQGGELNVLLGAEASLHSIRNIWCEVAFEEIYSKATFFSELREFLASRGFGIRAISDCERGKDGNLLWIDVLFSRPE